MLVYLPHSVETVMMQMVLDRRPESNIEDTLMNQRYPKRYLPHTDNRRNGCCCISKRRRVKYTSGS